MLNKRTDLIPGDAVYVGRPSKWGNPYPLARERDRLWVIQLYRGHLQLHPELVAAAKQEL